MIGKGAVPSEDLYLVSKAAGGVGEGRDPALDLAFPRHGLCYPPGPGWLLRLVDQARVILHSFRQ